MQKYLVAAVCAAVAFLAMNQARATTYGHQVVKNQRVVQQIRNVYVPQALVVQPVYTEQQVLVPAYDHQYSFSASTSCKNTDSLAGDLKSLSASVNALSQQVQQLKAGASAVTDAATPPGLAIFQAKCVSCHNGPAKDGRPQFADSTGALVALTPQAKSDIVGAVKYGAMPKGKPVLTDDEYLAVKAWLDIDGTAAAQQAVTDQAKESAKHASDSEKPAPAK